MENPCYNSQTNQDCPQRCPGCSVRCKAWQHYLIKRERARQLRCQKICEQRDFEAVSNYGIQKYKQKHRKRR